MKSKTKPEPTLREKAAALAVMASEVLLMVLEDPVAAAAPAAKPKVTVPKPAAKPKGRPPMTEDQRAAAKAAREVVAAPPVKPQPITRASLAAQNAAPAAIGREAVEPASYFTKAN